METTWTETSTVRRWTRGALVGLMLAAGAATAGCTPAALAGTTSSQTSEAAQDAREDARVIDEQLETAVAGTAADGQDAEDGLSPEEFCQLLRDTQPELDAAGDPLRAQLVLLGAASSAYEQRGALEGLQGSTLDELAASCPDDRDAVEST